MTLTDTIESLQRELQEVRRQSLEATRQGDFMKVARLTSRAASINRAIMDTENRIEGAKYGNPADSVRML